MGPHVPVRVTDDDRPGWAQLVLTGRVTVADARPFHAAAGDLVARGSSVAVRCAGAEYLDASAVQLLLCLGREVVRAGRQFTVDDVPDALAEHFRLAGLGGAPAA